MRIVPESRLDGREIPSNTPIWQDIRMAFRITPPYGRLDGTFHPLIPLRPLLMCSVHLIVGWLRPKIDEVCIMCII